MRLTARIAILAGAAGSVALTLYAGRNNPSFILMTVFTLWVLFPFAALAAASHRWPSDPLNVATLIVSAGSLAIYAPVALNPPPKPAFAFLMVPLAACLLIAVVVAIARRSQKSSPKHPQP